jgi:regulator of sigma E protease
VIDISSQVQSVNAGTPAAAAGLLGGDRIVAVNGERVQAADVRPAIQAANGAPLTLTVQRGGDEVALTPVRAERSPDGWLLGFRFDTERVGTRSYGVWGSVDKSVRTIGVVTRESLSVLGTVFRDQSREQLSTPVGIVDQGSQTVKEGSFPGLLALISLALAIFNLLPFLPLDGGHILFAVLEKVRGGRPISRSVFERVSVVGIAFMLVLFFIGITNDISRISSP